MNLANAITTTSDIDGLSLTEKKQLAVAATLSGGSEVKQAVDEVFAGASGRATDTLWTIIISGVIGCLVVAVIALMIFIYLGKQTEVVITVISSILTFIGGVFVKAPGSNS